MRNIWLTEMIKQSCSVCPRPNKILLLPFRFREILYVNEETIYIYIPGLEEELQTTRQSRSSLRGNACVSKMRQGKGRSSASGKVAEKGGCRREGGESQRARGLASVLIKKHEERRAPFEMGSEKR